MSPLNIPAPAPTIAPVKAPLAKVPAAKEADIPGIAAIAPGIVAAAVISKAVLIYLFLQAFLAKLVVPNLKVHYAATTHLVLKRQ